MKKMLPEIENMTTFSFALEEMEKKIIKKLALEKDLTPSKFVRFMLLKELKELNEFKGEVQ